LGTDQGIKSIKVVSLQKVQVNVQDEQYSHILTTKLPVASPPLPSVTVTGKVSTW
jgi:hypothetical protein